MLWFSARVLVALTAFFLLLPVGAQAASVSVTDRVMRFQAEPDERNTVELNSDYVGNTVHLLMVDPFNELQAAEGCTESVITGRRQVSCPVATLEGGKWIPLVDRIEFRLDDQDDSISLRATVNMGLHVYGGAGNDIIEGGSGPNRLYGEGGNDKITGGGDNDIIEGGAGNDTLNGEANADRLLGGLGNDKLYGGQGADYLSGGVGNDFMQGDDFEGGGSVAKYLGDVFDGGQGRDTVSYQSHMSDQDIRADADGEANDGTPREQDNISADVENLIGGGGDDTLLGDNGPNTLIGGLGRDRIEGRGGKDRVEGGDGDDTLFGQGGDDLLLGNYGNDLLFGGPGRDRLNGGWGDDRLNSKDGFTDRTICESGRDILIRDRKDKVRKSDECETVRFN